jgi:hypothetical protein
MKTKSIRRPVIGFSLGVMFAICIASLSGCAQGDGFDPKLFSFNHRVKGSGNLARETRNLDEILQVILSEEGDLWIEIGEQEQLVIEAEDNLLEYLVADVNHGSLDIKKDPDNVQLYATKPIRYFLTFRSLESLTVKNSGDVEIAEIKGARFKLRITGSGDVRINRLLVDSLEVELTSSGDLTISEGTANEQAIRLSSSGDYDGKNVVCQRARVSLSSSGEATVNVLERLIASTTSSGNVYYLGDPTVSIRDMTSSGRVIRYR